MRCLADEPVPLKGDAGAGCTPIRDYALIGDCHGSALVGCHGSIDWCCLERFDADPVFCSLLGGGEAGFFSIRPSGECSARRRYLPGTNILETTFLSAGGRATLTDFMPLGWSAEADMGADASINAPHWLVRVLDCIEGHVGFEIRYSACGPGFAAQPPILGKVSRGGAASDGPCLHAEIDLDLAGNTAFADVDLRAGQRLSFVVTPGQTEHNPCGHVDTLLAVTRAFWQDWLSVCNYRGPYPDAVTRSALVLKLLTYAPTGAIVAAPTTSLPEQIGGARNWDYRYCWLRDATFTLYALAALGYESEAAGFNRFLSRCLQKTAPDVHILYGIEYETELAERTVEYLSGYCGSRPVRTGNGAFLQRQFDIYGEILDWALLYTTLGGRISAVEKRLLERLADQVADSWREPGQGIWEMRGDARQHVYSKIMCWVALDRALRLFGTNVRWRRARDALHTMILERGIDKDQGYLRQSFGHSGIDAAVLTAPLVGFPLEQKTLARTVDAVRRALGSDGLLGRYLGAGGIDGIDGGEGAFLVCSFWLVDALLFLDRRDEAVALFETLLSKANDVGLLSEEIDRSNDAFLGNFPQALTHLALIRSAFVLELHEKGGSELLRGAHADRANQHAGATSDVGALWTAFKKSPHASLGASSSAAILHPFWRGTAVAEVGDLQ